MTQDKMVVWYHWLKGHMFEQTVRDSEGQKSWCVAVHGVAKSQTWPNDWMSPYILKKVWAKVISILAVLVLGKNDLNIKSGIP